MGRIACIALIACIVLPSSAGARTVEEMLDEADDLYWETRYYEALDVAREAVQWFPRSAEAQSLTGRILFKIGRFEEARERFEEAISIDRNDFWAFYGLGLYHLAEGDPETASEELALARTLWPDSELPCLMLARAFEEMNEYGEAARWMEEAVGRILAQGKRVPASLSVELDRLDFLADREPWRVSAAFEHTTVPMEEGAVITVRFGAGVEGRFLLDTTAARGLVAHPDVIRDTAGERIAVLGAARPGNRSPDVLVLLSQMTIGDLTLYDVPCLVTERVVPGVDGVIGLPVMRRFAWTFDHVTNSVTIVDPERDPAWAYRYNRGEISSRMYTGGPLMIPVRLYGERPAVMILDSASDAVSLDHEFFERDVMGLIPLSSIRDLRPDENPHGVTALTAFDLPSLDIGDERVLENTVVRTYSLTDSRRSAGVAAPGVLGLGALREWEVELDFPGRRMTLRNP